MPLAVSLGLCIIFFLALSPLLKDKFKRGLTLSLFFIALFSYGHLSRFIIGEERSLYFLIPYVIVFIALIVVTVIAKKDFGKFTLILNAVSLILVVFSFSNIMYFEIFQRKQITSPEDSYFNQLLEPKEIKTEAKDFPDIYYLIFDRFGSSEGLKEFYGFDNTPFDNHLQDKGFYVAAKSKTNYPYSYLSLSSSLNMEYLDYLFKQVGITSDKTIAYSLLQYPKIIRFLKSRGYKYYHLGTWWEPTRVSKHADRNFISEEFESKDFGINEFTTKLLRTTLLHSIMAKILPDRSVRGSKKILYQLKKLGEIPNLEGPKFVFAHILLTHPPYRFDRHGNSLSLADTEGIPEMDLYLDTVIFADTKIETLVDEIISKSVRPPIIVIQADEGPYAGVLKERGEEHSKRLRFRSSILNAYYLPGMDYSILYPTITPVNTFRLILNHYFGTDYEHLQDRTFISKNNDNIYQFVDITSRIYLGVLQIRSRPRQARIFINGKYINMRTGHTIRDLEPGTYKIRLVKEGYEEYETTVQLREADFITIRADLQKNPEREYLGTLIIRSKPRDADIHINGKPTGHKTNQILEDIKPGTYKIRLIKEGYEDFETTVHVLEADVIKINADLHKEKKS